MKGFKGIFLTTAASVLVMSGQAQAQSAAGVAEAGGDEIIVTAQRRSEDLQDVPISITALSGEDLQERALTDMRDILALTPGATFTAYNDAEPILSMRGISSGGEGAASDAAVLMLIDNEVISRDFMRSAPIIDLQRVEVLRGPQGTTYGRNATAGVLHVISRTPGDERAADMSLEVGSYKALKFDAGLDLPIGPGTLSRLAVQVNRRNGYFTDFATGKDVDNRQSYAGRFTLQQDLSENAKTTIRLHGSIERHGDTTPLKSYDPTKQLLGPPRRPSYTEPSTDPYVIVTTPGGSYFNREIWGISNEFVGDFGWATLTSLTAYRDGDNKYFQSSPLSHNNLDVYNKAQIFSQELRLAGDFADGQLYWLAGLFYLDEDIRYGFDRFGGSSIFVPPTTRVLRQVSSGRNLGIFGELNWKFTQDFTLTVGARYSKDKKKFSVYNQAQGPAAPNFVEDPSQPVVASVRDSWSKPTGRVSLQYRPNDDIMVYGSLSQGYKAGGFNSEPATLEAALTPFDEEQVLNKEVGARVQLFNRRVSFNLTAFEMDYKDIQVSSFTGSVEVIANAAKASIRGLELEAVVRPSRYFKLSLGASTYDGKYKRYITTSGRDLSGEKLEKTPEWTLAMSAVAETPVIADAGRLQLRGDYSTRADITHDAPADPLWGIRPGEHMVDLRLAWIPQPETWEVAFFVRNLLDKAEMRYIFPQITLSQRLVSYGAPRTFGLSFSGKF